MRPLEQSLLIAALGLAACASPEGLPDPPPFTPSPQGPAALVDPFVGTGDSNAPNPVTNGAAGSTFPGAALPFGMVQWGPDTTMASPAGYHFGNRQLTGFSLTHLSGAGCSAKRDFPVFPVVAELGPLVEPLDTWKDGAEAATAGYYRVLLDSGIEVALTATQRTGFARFTFPGGPSAKLLISGGWLGDTAEVNGFTATIGPDGTVTGHRTDSFFCGTGSSYAAYFAARFDPPPTASGTWSGGGANPGDLTVSGSQSGVYLAFDTGSRRVVHMKVGLSYVSEQNAAQNLDAESPGWDFGAVYQAAMDRWNGLLGRVAVEGGAGDDQKRFYSALYHVLLQPGVASDVNGDRMGFDGKPKNDTSHARYADFSGWDVYRSWIQLAALVAPAETSDMMQSLVASADECGALPRWALESTETGVMVGDPSDAILASAYALGARGFDAQGALAHMVKGATDPSAACNGFRARPGLADYLTRHYCPADGAAPPDGPPSSTLEYATADFAVSRLAAALGDAANEAIFTARGAYWKNVFDPDLPGNGFTGYVAPRLMQDQNGKPAFVAVDVGKGGGFVEGNATTYTFCVPQDFAGLFAALGGDGTAKNRLDAIFTQVNAGLEQPYFYMGNEPGFAIPWAYAWAGAPAGTQGVVRRILHEAFGSGPSGLPGNDDLGAMSSWQVWAMLGLYPAVPGVGGFVLGSPSFVRATITLGGGDPSSATSKKIVITASGAASDAPYVQSLAVGGKPSTSTWVSWDSVSQGGTLDFVLGTMPSATWGTGPSDRPPSFYP